MSDEQVLTPKTPTEFRRQLLGLAMAEQRAKHPGWRGSKIKRVGMIVVEKWLSVMAKAGK